MILIAGPCVIESRDNLFRVAEKLVSYHEDKTIDFYFKSSFDKANRTSIDSFWLNLEVFKRRSLLSFGYRIL